MEFTNEYHILSNINHHSILELEYIFHNQTIKIYFNSTEENEFLVLVCELETGTIVRNLAFYQIEDEFHINGYWGKYYKHVKTTLVNNTDYKFSEFFDSIKEAIQSINNPIPLVTVTQLSQKSGLSKIRNIESNSVYPNDRIYYNHIRRQIMTTKQYEKISNILGVDAAKYLKKLNLNAAFVKDISRQKRFILEEND